MALSWVFSSGVHLPPLRCFISSGHAPFISASSSRNLSFSRLLLARKEQNHTGARFIRVWNIAVELPSNPGAGAAGRPLAFAVSAWPGTMASSGFMGPVSESALPGAASSRRPHRAGRSQIIEAIHGLCRLTENPRRRDADAGLPPGPRALRYRGRRGLVARQEAAAAAGQMAGLGPHALSVCASADLAAVPRR